MILTAPALLYVATTAEVKPADIQQWCWELGEAFGPGRFDLRTPHNHFPDRATWRHALEWVNGVELPSGLSLFRDDQTTTVLRCWVAASYYGPGLEAGDAPFLLTLMSWLEARIPFARIYYGADLPDVGVKHLAANGRGALMRHFLKLGHVPFRLAHARRLLQQFSAPHCGFCLNPFRQVEAGPLEGWGGFVCDGCGHGAKTNDGGQSYEAWEPGKPLTPEVKVLGVDDAAAGA